MPRGAFYNSIKALVVSWLVFFAATVGQIVLPLEFLKKLTFLNAVIPDSVVASHLRLANLVLTSDLTLLDRLLVTFTSTTAGFVGSFREIFIIIVVCNMTIFRDDKYPLLSLFLIGLRKVLKLVDLDEYFMGSERPSLSLFGGESLKNPLTSVGAAIIREVLKMLDLDEYFLGHDDRPSLSLFGGDHEEEMPELEYCPTSESLARSGNNDDFEDYGFDFESEFQRRNSQNSDVGSPTASPMRRAAAVGGGTRDGQMSPMNSSNYSSNSSANNEPREWFVFDSVYGVIPFETKELWQQQEAESLRRRQQQSSKREKKVIPVRFSTATAAATGSTNAAVSSSGGSDSDSRKSDMPCALREGDSRSLF